jgi:hypothetical protein
VVFLRGIAASSSKLATRKLPSTGVASKGMLIVRDWGNHRKVMVRRHRGSVRPRGGKKRALRVAVDIASSVEAIDRNIVIRPAVNVTYRPPMSPDMTVR